MVSKPVDFDFDCAARFFCCFFQRSYSFKSSYVSLSAFEKNRLWPTYMNVT